MPVYKPEDLPELVREIDSVGGGWAHHPSLSHLKPFKLVYDTHVDESLCPFSSEYFSQQIQLYEEISNRKLDQENNELHPQYNIGDLVNAPNPLGICDVDISAEQVRGLATMVAMCGLGDSPKILDLGAGHGLASELFAYLGCKVHSVDIDPELGRLASIRAGYKKLNIHRYTQNFENLDNITSDFDAAFFFQSLHHSLKPWELIHEVKKKLNSDRAPIAFTGEPINNFWKNWGLRLDIESAYVARKFGWFESGWSGEFLEQCFRKNGMRLKQFTGGHAQSSIGIAKENWECDSTENYLEKLNMKLVSNKFGLSLLRWMGYRLSYIFLGDIDRYDLYRYKQIPKKVFRWFFPKKDSGLSPREVESLYQRILNRSGDPEGIDWYTGQTYEKVSTGLYRSDEYRINKRYKDVFGRPLTFEERAQYRGMKIDEAFAKIENEFNASKEKK